MHLYPRRRNVAAQEAEELKTVTYATPSYGGERTKKEKKVTVKLMAMGQDQPPGSLMMRVAC